MAVALSRIELQGVPYLQAVARDISECKKVEEELRRTNQEMARWVDELGKRNQQALMLNQMGNLLQSCLADDEVCTVLGSTPTGCFPGWRERCTASNGARFIRNGLRPG